MMSIPPYFSEGAGDAGRDFFNDSKVFLASSFFESLS